MAHTFNFISHNYKFFHRISTLYLIIIHLHFVLWLLSTFSVFLTFYHILSTLYHYHIFSFHILNSFISVWFFRYKFLNLIITKHWKIFSSCLVFIFFFSFFFWTIFPLFYKWASIQRDEKSNECIYFFLDLCCRWFALGGLGPMTCVFVSSSQKAKRLWSACTRARASYPRLVPLSTAQVLKADCCHSALQTGRNWTIVSQKLFFFFSTNEREMFENCDRRVEVKLLLTVGLWWRCALDRCRSQSRTVSRCFLN